MRPASAACWWLVLAILPAAPARATFTDIGAGITGVTAAAVAWGDYDADGDLDFVMTGTTVAGDIARIYCNTAGVFADALALPADAAVHNGAVAWGDYDRDGDLDLALAGARTPSPIMHIYRNDAGIFSDIGAGLPGVSTCAISWVDFDNDGDLDLAFAGNPGTGAIAHVYRNTAGIFADTAAPIAGLTNCAMAWADYDDDGDYDNDGDLDLAISGSTSTSPITRVYRNTGGFFADAGAVIQGVYSGASMWGDADNDGDLDIALAGNTASTGFAAVYANSGGAMTDISAGLIGVAVGISRPTLRTDGWA